MANCYEIMRQRMVNVLVNGLGTDGSLGPLATARSIPAGRFRESAARAPLTDTAYPAAQFDRAITIDWISDEEEEFGNNPLDGPQFLVSQIAVTHGVAYGQGAGAWTTVVGSETEAGNALGYRERGLNDALRMRRALSCQDLMRGGTPASPTDPIIITIIREGSTTLNDLGNGRMVVTTLYGLHYQVDNDTPYDP